MQWQTWEAADDTAEYELYDDQADPSETKNLAAQRPETVAKLVKILATHPVAKRPAK